MPLSPFAWLVDRDSAMVVLSRSRRREVRRREFLTFGGTALIWRQPTCAQQGARARRIGVLETIPRTLNAANFSAFQRGLEELGYIEGQNIVIEYRSADGRQDRFADLAGELVRLNVDLIVTR